MKITKKYPDGMFSWAELATTDIDAAHVFYSGLFGWNADLSPIDEQYSYTTFRLGGYSVAGGGPMMADAQAAGVPSHWDSYINHSDIDAVVARAAEAGGVILVPPMDVMDLGRMAHIQDPTGASLGVWQPKTFIGAQIVNQPNSLVWNELQTSDTEAAGVFYKKVFGWGEQVDDTSGYSMWHDNDGRVHCGLVRIDESWGDASPNWLVYFLVDDVDATAARAAELGGTAVYGPVQAGEMGRLAILADPQGAVFAVIRFDGGVDDPPGME